MVLILDKDEGPVGTNVVLTITPEEGDALQAQTIVVSYEGVGEVARITIPTLAEDAPVSLNFAVPASEGGAHDITTGAITTIGDDGLDVDTPAAVEFLVLPNRDVLQWREIRRQLDTILLRALEMFGIKAGSSLK